jgi:hypothetical protein
LKPNQLNFLVWSKSDISVPGIIIIEKEGVKLKLNFDVTQFESSVETVSLSDKRLSNVWGGEVYRVSLTARKMQLSGKYKISISR